MAGNTKTAGEAVYAYTPGLKIKEAVRVRKVRELPIPGDVLVDMGAAVDFDNYLFQYKKKHNLSDTALAHIDEIHKEFSILFTNLLYER